MNEIIIRLDRNGAAVPGGQLLLGYMGNHGNYRLRVDARSEWQGLTIRAHWHGPGPVTGTTLVENGGLDVPAAVTAQPGPGCITFEGSDGSRTVTSADVRYRVAANSGTEDAEMPKPGTPAWETFVGPWLGKLDRIDEAEQNAAGSAKQAAESAADAERSRQAILEKELFAAENAEKAAQSEKNAAASAADARKSQQETAASAEGVKEEAGRLANILENYTGGFYRTYELTLPAENWVELETPVGRYWYRCDVLQEDCNSALVPMGTLTLDEAGETEKANIATVCQTGDGVISFYAAVPPTVDIRVLMTLFAKGTASIVQASDEEVLRMLDDVYRNDV